MYKEVAIMWRNKESYVDEGGVFGLSIIKHVTLQKIVAHDFRYDPRNLVRSVSRSRLLVIKIFSCTLCVKICYFDVILLLIEQGLSCNSGCQNFPVTAINML